MNAAILALLLKVTAILGSAALAALVLRRSSAAWRHFVWSAAMTSVIVLVVLQLVVPPIFVRIDETSPFRALARPAVYYLPPTVSARAVAQSTDANNVVNSSASTEPANQTTKRVQSLTTTNDSPSSILTAASSPESTVKTETGNSASDATLATASIFSIETENASSLLLIVWAMGSLLLLLRLGRSRWHLNRLVRWSQPSNNRALREELDQIRTRLNVHARVRLLIHPHVNTPCTAGWWNPMVMLPANHAEWSNARTRAVLMHEVAHIERRDSLWQTIASIVCALFWFHPACWMAARLLRSESERAADDVVINAGMSPVEYADHLLAIADRSEYLNRVPAAAVGMASTAQLETRLRAMLNARQSRRRLTRSTQRVAGIASLLAVAPLAAVQARVQNSATSVSQPPAARKAGKLPQVNATRAKMPAFNMPQTKPSLVNPSRAKVAPVDVTHPVKKRKPFGLNGNVKPERMDTVIDKTIALAKNDDVFTVYSDIASDVEFHESTTREVRVRATIPAAFSEVNVSFDRMRTGPQLTLSSTFARKSGTFRLRYEIWMPKNMQLYVAPNGGPTTYGIDLYGIRGVKNVQQLSIQGWMDIGCITFAIKHIASDLHGTLTCGLPTLPLSGFVPLKVTVNGEAQIDRIRSTILGSQTVVPFVKNYSISSPFLQLKADSAVISAHKDTLRIEYNRNGGRVVYNELSKRD